MQDDYRVLVRLINTILEYHNIQASDELRKLWLHDLKNFSVKELYNAWNIFRQDDSVRHKRITSIDLVKIVRANNKQFVITDTSDSKSDRLNKTVNVDEHLAKIKLLLNMQ